MYSDLKSELMGWAGCRGIGESWLVFESNTVEGWRRTEPRLHLASDLAGILTLASNPSYS
ncbi:hypothetical protein DF3PA_410009 [Candidatus Defluviicoccus seviourii]|uniref:Uncharacterized protein n=1 Tax=Candidatus Defluviicoccus seviourii TaxID=2565273 RepID=A0A564WFS7_9PROT|nr:hypothetical protein DF3PA_410009 [Candidatus Defluviicoccus seviourii]